MAEAKIGNPAVVGLGGFGMTTLILQFHNLGWCAVGPVLFIGLLFGGTAQLIAGLLEFKTGNNLGFCAFTGYGAFWISLCFFLIFGTNAELAKLYPTLAPGKAGFDHQLGIFMLMWTFFTIIMFIATLYHNTATILLFGTLVLGFVGLDLVLLNGMTGLLTITAWDLIVCALLAWYIMAATIYADTGLKLPVGGPWIKPTN